MILGFLSEAPLTGYDLKKKFSESDIFPWSGNNNQIYRTLVELHDEKLVTIEVEHQDSKPPRKIYTITETGLEALRQWMLSMPELPQFRSPLSVQLNWADQLDRHALDEMLTSYEEELKVHIAMLHEQIRRKTENWLSVRIADHWISFYQLELDWIDDLRRDLFP